MHEAEYAGKSAIHSIRNSAQDAEQMGKYALELGKNYAGELKE